MGKSTRGSKEWSREQELKYENQKLRREISALRKQLARIDLDRYSQVKEIVEEHLAQEETEESTQNLLKRMKEEWKCKKCGDGYLEIFLYNKAGEIWYLRKCNNPHCDHKTKGQRYDPGKVQGIIKNQEKDEK